MTDIAVHPEFEQAGSFGHLRLGRVEPDEPIKLQLGPYVAEAFEPPPPTADFYSAVPSWPMYGNDTLGDCTWAAIGHMIEAWTAVAGAEKVPALADIEQGYWETGKPPSATGTAGSPTDDGRMEPQVLSYWRHNGVPNSHDSIIGYAAVAPHNLERLKFTIANFGGAYVALAMPLTAESQSIWDFVPNTPDNAQYSWGGHAVPILGYDASYLYCVTWGFVMKMTWAFWAHYGVAAYAVISPDFAAKAAAAGVNVEAMKTNIGVLDGTITEAEALAAHEAAGAVLPEATMPATSDPQNATEAAHAPEEA